MFDRAEYDMRKAEELKDAFTVYDQLATETVTQFPIMQRLQAKMISRDCHPFARRARRKRV